jgi:hypothetical protein
MTVTAGSDGSVLLGSYQAGFRRDRKAVRIKSLGSTRLQWCCGAVVLSSLGPR